MICYRFYGTKFDAFHKQYVGVHKLSPLRSSAWPWPCINTLGCHYRWWLNISFTSTLSCTKNRLAGENPEEMPISKNPNIPELFVARSEVRLFGCLQSALQDKKPSSSLEANAKSSHSFGLVRVWRTCICSFIHSVMNLTCSPSKCRPPHIGNLQLPSQFISVAHNAFDWSELGSIFLQWFATRLLQDMNISKFWSSSSTGWEMLKTLLDPRTIRKELFLSDEWFVSIFQKSLLSLKPKHLMREWRSTE